MLKRKFLLKILMLFAVNLCAIDTIWAMTIKIEPEEINEPYRQRYPVIELDEIIKVFAAHTINPHNYTNNCVSCAISCYRWLNDRTHKPRPITKKEKASKNMECDDDFAELIKEIDNINLSPKVVRIYIEDNLEEPLKATFDAVVLKEEGKFRLLSNYLSAIPLKTLSGSKTSFRVGLLYLINKSNTKTGHMINFYKISKDNLTKIYILDPQKGTAQELDSFLESQAKYFLNYAYIWYDKGDFEIPLEYRRDVVKIEPHEIIEIDDEVVEDVEMELDIKALVEEVLSDKLPAQAAAKLLAQALARNDSKNAEIAIEQLAMDPNNKVKNLCSMTLYLAARNKSEKAVEAIRRFATWKYGINYNKVAAQALVFLINDGHEWPRGFLSVIAGSNPIEVKTGIIAFISLIMDYDSAWAKTKLGELALHYDANPSFNAALVLGTTAGRGSIWAQNIFNDWAKNNAYQIIVSQALKRAVEINSVWGKNTIGEFAHSDNQHLRKIALLAGFKIEHQPYAQRNSPFYAPQNPLITGNNFVATPPAQPAAHINYFLQGQAAPSQFYPGNNAFQRIPAQEPPLDKVRFK